MTNGPGFAEVSIVETKLLSRLSIEWTHGGSSWNRRSHAKQAQ